MKAHPFHLAAVVLFSFVLGQSALAQWSTPPATSAETERLYTEAIEKRANDILTALAVPDPAKCIKVHDIIVAQYRSLRARDEAIDSLLRIVGKDVNYTNRSVYLLGECRPLHDQFLAKLTAVLTPEQIEKVKDKMTYNKVKVTYDAYCSIIPDLTDSEKAKILEQLTLAREEAMDGGSAPEKSEIFQKYKNQINTYLTSDGHDVAKAFKDWDAKQDLAKKTTADASAKPAEAAK